MASNLSQTELEQCANTIRFLAADGVEKAKSGHPGMPMGMAELAAVLWLKYLRINPEQPKWVNRDRFILSNGHGCMLIYSLLHLSGFNLSLDDLKSFRQWESKTPGHPETHFTEGVEATTGPLGQGISNAVGMAIGEKLMQSRYPGLPLDHKIFVFAGDGCLMEGVSSEAGSLAGHLGLDNIVVVYDDNHISIAGSTDLAFTEDVALRYQSYGWHTLKVDGHNFDQIDAALTEAVKVKGKPVLIAARTIIGKGAPHKANDAEVHGSPLGQEELDNAKRGLNWPTEPMFYVPDDVRKIFADRRADNLKHYKQWSEKFESWRSANAELAKLFDQQRSLSSPADLTERLLAALPTPAAAAATRKLSSEVLQKVSELVPSLVGGSADLEPSTFTLIKKSSDVQRGKFEGKNLRFGVREHGMGAVMNGLAYYGGFIPYGSTFLTFSDYMRPTVRLAAFSHLPGLFIFTHDSIFLGEDGPTHQPIEHLQSLRLIPNLWVMRPADGVEVAVCYSLALKRTDGPTVLALSRQNVDPLERPAAFSVNAIEKGAYTVFETAAAPEYVFVATGSEVGLAIAAAKALGKPARVVSMPCAELFCQQPLSFREGLIPEQSKRVVIEAGATRGWLEIVGGTIKNTLVVGIDRFGASAPAKVLAEKFGFTATSVVAQIAKQFG